MMKDMLLYFIVISRKMQVGKTYHLFLILKQYHVQQYF